MQECVRRRSPMRRSARSASREENRIMRGAGIIREQIRQQIKDLEDSIDRPPRSKKSSRQQDNDDFSQFNDFSFSDPWSQRDASSKQIVDPIEEEEGFELAQTYNLKRSPTGQYTTTTTGSNERDSNMTMDSDIVELEPNNMFEKEYILNDLQSRESLATPFGKEFLNASNNPFRTQFAYDCEKKPTAVVTPMVKSDRREDRSSFSSSSSSASARSARNKSGFHPRKTGASRESQVPELRSQASCPSRNTTSSNSYLPTHLDSTQSSNRLSSLLDLELFDNESEDRYESPKSKHSAATHSSSSGSSQRSSNPSKQRSSLCNLYGRLLEDSAYEHAMRAGFLWQSIVGQHVKFPKTWWNEARGPPMGNAAENARPWVYYGRQPVYNNYVLTQLVQGRASAGRLLLHICVQDLMTMSTIQDIAIGCFHPNAKGIRQTDQALRSLEACREVWMAVRKHSDSVSAVDSLLDMAQQWSRGPLGHGRRITNTNVRSVFGERPPLETIFMSEDEVYERLSMRILQPRDPVSPCVAVLEEFVFA